MHIAIKKVHAEYDEPVGIPKVIDSNNAARKQKLGYM